MAIFRPDYWEGGMAIMIIENSLLTGILYSSLLIIILDLVLNNLELGFDIKTIIITIISVLFFALVLLNEINEFATFSLNPLYWFM
jgi:hypothetical protein